MIEQIKSVEAFHKAMGLTVNEFPTFKVSNQDGELRDKLMKEELDEAVVEMETPVSLPNLTKELADLLVVTFGTIVTYGLQDVIVPVFEEIMRANMSKLDENGKPVINGQNGVLDESRPLGKVLKSSRYVPADVSKIFE